MYDVEVESTNFSGRFIIVGEGVLTAKTGNTYVISCEGEGKCIEIDFGQKKVWIPCIDLEVSFQSSVLVDGLNYNNSHQTLPNGVYEIEID